MFLDFNLCFISAELLDRIEGTPPMSSSQDETGVKLIITTIIILLW